MEILAALEAALTPTTADGLLRLILAVITLAFTPAWIMYSKYRLQRSGLIDLLNSFTTCSNAVALLVVPIQRFVGFGPLVSVAICLVLTWAMYRYLATPSAVVYEKLRNDFGIEYPEFSITEEGETA